MILLNSYPLIIRALTQTAQDLFSLSLKSFESPYILVFAKITCLIPCEEIKHFSALKTVTLGLKKSKVIFVLIIIIADVILVQESNRGINSYSGLKKGAASNSC